MGGFNTNGMGEVTDETILDGFTITGAFNDGGPSARGGGIYATAGYPRIESCTITGNHTDGSGGGAYLDFQGIYDPAIDVLRLTNCAITNNTAAQSGGGILIFGRYEPPAVSIVRSSITDNSALDDHGGGVRVSVFDLSDPADFIVELFNCRIERNDAVRDGGGMALSSDQSVSERVS